MKDRHDGDTDPTAMDAKLMPGAAPREIVLLLPGMTLNATIFPELGVPSLAVDFNRVVHGRDGGAAADERMTPYVRMLDAFLSGIASWRQSRRYVIGHSFGGVLALEWLLAHQSEGLARIDGLVLIGATAGPMFDMVRIRLGRFRGRERRLKFAWLLPLWNAAWLTRSVKQLVSRGSGRARPVDFRALQRRSDLALDLAGWRNTDWRAMRAYRLALRGFDVRHRLREIGVRTIVLHGVDDTLLPVRAAEELAAGLPNAELRVVPGAAHGLPLTHGDAVRQAFDDLRTSGP